LNLSRGVKNRSRTRPTWVSTWPFSQPAAGVCRHRASELLGREVIHDAHAAYRLAPAPRGYQYVRVGEDVALTAISTGVIASVIQQLFQ
jgi:hypothetical protein